MRSTVEPAAGPSVRRRAQAAGWAALLALMLGYAAIFAAYYPPLSGIEDEVGFVNQAMIWSHGAVSPEGAGLLVPSNFIEVDGRHVAIRQPGRSLLVLPFLALGGVRATFASGLLLHLATTAIGGALLARLGRSPLWAALLLFHPTMALYSRTIMGDEAAGAGLLLAALATTAKGPAAGLGAGLAVGLAALMRYHAGLALPAFAAALWLDPGRPKARRDALVCLLAGTMAGGLIVGYNLALFGHPSAPDPNVQGSFSLAYLPQQLPFYAGALMAIWPAMFPAPLLDHSRIRWAARGVCGLFFALFSCYYFHDTGSGWLDTMVIGQRLIQVALPIWVVSYANVVDVRVALTVRRRLGGRAWTALVALTCAGLLAGTALMFQKHQDHLGRLRAGRDATIAAIPEGSLVVADISLSKLFGIPIGMPAYRWRELDFQGDPIDHTAELGREEGPWYLGVLARVPGAPIPDAARTLIDRYAMEPVSTGVPDLTIYVARDGRVAGPSRARPPTSVERGPGSRR